MGRENEKEAVTGRWDPKHEDYFLEAKEWRSHKCLPEDELKEHEHKILGLDFRIMPLFSSLDSRISRF